MLTIKIHTGEDGCLLSLAGHAGAGKKGSDIVCAAASILAYTGAASVRQLYRAGKLSKAPVIRLSPGDARIEIFDGGQAGEQLFDTLQTGFALLAAKYPNHVKLEAMER